MSKQGGLWRKIAMSTGISISKETTTVGGAIASSRFHAATGCLTDQEAVVTRKWLDGSCHVYVSMVILESFSL
jgi:hypothetical protein